MDAVALTAYPGKERTLGCGCQEVEVIERWIDSQARFSLRYGLVIVPEPDCAEHSRKEGRPW